MEQKVFFTITFGFLTGVLLASVFSISPTISILIGFVGLIFLIVGILNFVTRKISLVISIFLIFVAVGTLRFYLKDSGQPKHLLDNFLNEEVLVEGIISAEVDTRENSQRLVVFAHNLNFKNEDYEIDQKILVSTELFPRYFYGDRVLVSAKLESPENFITDTGKEFDYKSYLKKDSIFYTMSFAEVEILGSSEESALKSAILSTKRRFLDSISLVVPQPESALLGGLLLGTKQSLGEKLQKAFVDIGLVHIVVLSGYNVTIIAEALIKVLSFISVSAGIYLGSFAIVIFTIMTGAGATIVRASIMAILALLARATGRNSEITRALILAGSIMVLQNPYILAYDISFQLSFLATLGLIYVSPIFFKIFKFIPERFGLREITGASIGVQVFVLPFILYKMGNLSLVSPITNVLVLPFIPITMLFGFLGGLFGFITPILATPFGLVAYIFLKFEIFIVETFAKLSIASITITRFPLLLVILFYAVAFYYLWRYHNKSEKS